MNILLTGVTGFIGKHLVKALLKNGHNPVCLIRENSVLGELQEYDLPLYIGDITRKESLTDIPENLHAVLHLAARVDFSSLSAKSFLEMVNTNVEGTKNLFEAVIKRNPRLKKFIFFSTLASLGFQRGQVVSNRSEPVPDTPYGQSKLLAEREISNLCQNHNIPLVILRPSLVYGTGDYKSDFLNSVRYIKKGLFPIFGSGDNIMSPLIFTQDLIEICCRFLIKESGGTFICARNEEFTVNQFVTTIKNIVGVNKTMIRIPVKLGQTLIFPLEIICRIMDKPAPLNQRRIKDLSVDRRFSKIHEDLENAIAYHPSTTLEQGCRIVIPWYKEEGLI
ncbi:MAG: NAD(P)-dependent oxidoreductase [Candidatus Cloacimonetes bacterium]|nr:NAD(P)-dependent oxidoreductase [Candidatus Cloacimonadota bacterium]